MRIAANQDVPVVPSGWPRPLAKPRRLYGRQGAVASLMQSFSRIGSGQGEVVLVPGYSGVGKTALVREIRKPVGDRNGFFIQGKFNQYQQNIPYFAVRQALAELARELLSEEEPLRQQWKSELRRAVGALGRLLVDLVPDLDSLLGPQPSVAEISPLEARHRFAGVVRNFLEAVCQPEHPVVLFIDDWQCADTASFELLKQLQIGTTLRYLLVIAAYRDNEVDRGHPLIATVEELRRQTVPVSVIEVRDIGLEDVRTWVKDLLQPAAENPEALAEIIHRRTKGNPFFTQASLAFLNDLGLLYLDSNRDCWRWKMEADGEGGLPDDAVDLFRLRLRRLDRGRRNLLAQAACLGNRFDMDSLAAIGRRRPDKCRSLLFGLQEIVAPVGAEDRGGHPSGDGAPQWFMFVHDRVQQAAYGMIPAEDLPSVRLEIGRQLLARLSPEQLAEHLFEVTNHLNSGQLLIEDPAERVRAVELNVAAARKARAATAYRAALDFHRAAGRFLAVPAFAELLWSRHHELAISLFQEWAESEFLEGDRTEAERYIRQAVVHARTPIEKAEALNILIVQNTLQARYPEAIAAGRQALAALGIILPEEGCEAACDTEIEEVRRNLGGRSVGALADLPVMSHPEMRMAGKILIAMGPPCYRSHQRLWGVIVPKAVNLTLQHGNVPQVGYSHTAFGGLLCWVANDFSLAREFGELATRLMAEAFHSPSDRSVYHLMIGSSVRHWFHPLKRASEDYAEACEIGLQSGNLQYTAYAFGHNMYCRFYQGASLGDLIQESRKSLAFSRTRLNQWAIDLLEGGLRIFSSLSGSEGGIGGSETLLEADYLARVEAHRNIQVTCVFKILKAFFLLVLGRCEEALETSDQTEPILYTVGMQGLLPWPEHVFARLLILTAITPGAGKRRQVARRAELDRILAQVRLWADCSPENFEHKYQLAAAELARLDHRPTEAMALYERAIDGARAGGFVQWEGMANERAARFWQERGNDRLAQVYWHQAYGCFARWGANAKLQTMEAEYRQWLAADLPQPPNPADLPAAQARGALLEKQVQRLRSQAFQAVEARARGEVERQAGELARATEHLRAEVAERKRTEEDLRLHRELLEERVRERTAELDAANRWMETEVAERKEAEESLWTIEKRLRALSLLQELLLPPNPIGQKLKLVTEAVVRIVDADLARIWMINPGDRCETGCPHAQVTEGPHTCRFRDRCLHLMASSGRYTHTDGGDHSRVPFGCYKIGRVAAAEEPMFLTNDVTNDPLVHNHAWAKDLGLVSFAGYRLVDGDGNPLGVLAIFSKQAISAEEDSLMEGIAHATSQVLRSARAEAALRESELRFRMLIEKSMDGFALLGADGIVRYQSPSLLNLQGYTPEERNGRDGFELVHPDDLAATKEVFARIQGAAGRSEMVTTRLRHKDGSWRWFETVVTNQLAEPAIGAFIINFRDITERMRKEESLRRLNRELRAITNCHQILLRAVDEAALLNDICRIICDEAGYRLAWVGYAEHDDAKTVRPVAWAGFDSVYIETVKLSWSDHAERGRDPGGTAIRSGEIVYIQDITTDPRMVPWREIALQRGYRSVIGLPLKDENANVFGVLLIYSTAINAFTPDELRLLEQLSGDLAFGIMVLRARAERKRAEKVLQESESRYRRITEGITDYQYSVRVENGRAVATTQSPACAIVTGYTAEEFAADPYLWFHMVAPEDRGLVHERVQRILAGKDIPPLEHRICRKDGETRWVSDTIILFKDASGNLVSYDGVIKDITVRKLAEDEVHKLNRELELRVTERTAQLEAANKELGAFAYSVSHDLRAPLRIIDGFSQALQEDCASKLDEEGKDSLRRIRAATQRMGHLIDDMLSLSRVTRGELRIEPVNLSSLAHEIAGDLARREPERKVSLAVAPEVLVAGDTRLLRITLENLIGNAWKYTSKCPEATIEFGVTKQEGQRVYFVRDNGAGFDMKYAGKLFGPFQRLHTTDEFPGTGVGLATVQRIIHRHGGRIWAEGKIHHGATFHFSLPPHFPEA